MKVKEILNELVSPKQAKPGKQEQNRRKELATDIIGFAIKANPTKQKHTEVFSLVNQLLSTPVDSRRLQKDKVMQQTRINSIVNSDASTVKLHSIKKKMENIINENYDETI